MFHIRSRSGAFTSKFNYFSGTLEECMINFSRFSENCECDSYHFIIVNDLGVKVYG